MADPYWIKSSGLGAGAPYYGTVPPVQQQSHQMPQHQVPQQHPAQQLPQQHQQYPNMSWHQEPPKAAPSDSWGPWHNQQQQPPQPSNNAAQNYAAYNYAQQQSTQAHVGDPWNWGVDAPQQASVQQQHNNNIDQSFQNDISWNWSMDQSTPSQNSVNYYQMGYGGQQAYTDQSVNAQTQLASNNNLGYSEATIEHKTSLNVQDLSNVNQFSEPTKVEGEEYKTEQPVETSERYEDQLEPAMSETSKNSMTPQWSIESQVSQDSDDISSSIGQTTSQAKSEDSGQRPPGYLSGDAQNLWDDTEDEDDMNERNAYLEQVQESNTSAPLGNEVDRHSKLNLDETITALESLKVTADPDLTALDPSGPLVAPPLRAPSVPTEPAPRPSVFPLPSGGPPGPPGPPANMPPSSGGPPSSLPPPASMPPPSGGPPASLPPSSGPPSGSNPYSVNRTGLTHKSASKLFSGSGMSRQLFAPPLQPGSVLETSQVPPETLPRMPDHQLGAVENRSQDPPAGQEFGGSADLNAQVPLNSWPPVDSHDVAPRFGLDRNQYLETGQLTSQTSEEESAPPPGLHRLVTGQLTEQDSQVSTPPPGLDRMIPGQITERDGMRMVPGRMAAADDDDDDDDFNDSDLRGISPNIPRSASRDPIVEHSSNLRRMIPGQTDSQEEEDEMPNISIGQSDLPPGLHRMVPGESSSPESQTNNAVGLQNSEINSAFQPIEPREPRVVTGVAMESIPPPVVAPSPQQTIKLEPASSSPDHSHESRGAGIAQPPSERSETIGSDGVDEKAADNPVKKSERRSRDDADSDRDEREPRGRDRDYYRRDRDEDRDRDRDRDGDRSMSPSESGSNRYRDDRDRDRRYDSPEGQGRSRYRSDRDRDRRTRDKDTDYDSERRYDPRRDRDHRAKRDGSGDKEGRRRGYNREEDEGESEDYGSDREDRKWNRDRDADRDRNREGDRDRERERYRERDRFRDRDGYRERDRDRDRADRSYGEDYFRREKRGRDGRDELDKGRRSGGRRSDDYHRGYDEDYYRDRRTSRPSSRSGSVHEYGHAYERDYRDDRHDRSDRSAKYNQYHPGGYYYNPQEYYRYQMYYANLRKTDPEAYAAWYRKYYSQYAASQPGTYEDRGSVHSGRSSANEELSNQRFDRHRSPNRAQAYYQKSPQTSSSNRYQSTDNASPFSRESGRGVGHGESSLDETNSSIQRLTPFKFSTAHVKGILTRGGHLLKVLPHYPLDGQSATVEVHSTQSLIPQDQNLQDLLALPGPLVRGVTHKKTIILYLRAKMESTRNNPAIYDGQSVVLLYELLILLLRQNGMIVGTDIAELLLRNGDSSDADDSWSTDHRAQSTPSPAPSGGSRTSSASATPAVQVVNASISQQPKLSEMEITNKFREFLLYGNTKEALEWAMKHGLWGHALFLSSKLDQRMYHSVMTRFANGLALTDPIQTLYQLLSGWQPAAVTCVADDKWGDWRPHLAMILSNTSSRPEIDHKAIMTLGDTLSARGCLHASHFCYLMAQHPFGTYSQRASKYVLLGSSHLRSFAEFASNESIMITCIYEYARSLADPNFHIPNLQPYKYLMATRLVEAHLLPEAVHYCEVVSRLIVQNPQQYEPSFVRDIGELSESLKFHDPFYSAGGDLSAQGDPDWLLQLRSVSSNNTTYANYTNYGESYSNTSYSAMQGDTTHDQTSVSSHSMDPAMYAQEMPHQHVPTEPQQEQVQQHEEQQPQLPAPPEQLQQQSYYYQDQQQQQPWSLQEGHHQQTVDPSSYSTDGYGNVETDQSGWWSGQQEEVPSISMDSSAPMVSGQTNLESGAKASKPPMQEQPIQVPKPMPSVAAVQTSSSSPPSPPTASAKTANRQPAAQSNTQSNSSWFGGLWNKLALRPKNQMKLPDDKNPSIVWDDQKKRWVNSDGDGEEEGANLAPPPKMSEMPGRFAPPGPGPAPAPAPAPNMPSITPVVANGAAGIALSTPISSAVPSTNEGENVAAKPPNMFKLPRGRSLRASYVDVMNPNGTKASGPNSLPPPNLFPTSASQPSSLNYFVPATVEGNENAPTDFLTPAPVLSVPSESVPDQQPLSRWSSTSSLSREVQSYTSRRPPSRNQVQAGPTGPQMFNPAQFSQQTFTSSAPRKRYAN